MLRVACLFFFVWLGWVSNRNAIYFIFPTVFVFKILGERADYAETNRVKDLI